MSIHKIQSGHKLDFRAQKAGFESGSVPASAMHPLSPTTVEHHNTQSLKAGDGMRHIRPFELGLLIVAQGQGQRRYGVLKVLRF